MAQPRTPGERERVARRFRLLVPLVTAMLLVAQFPTPAAADHGGRPIGSAFPCRNDRVPPRCTSVGNNLKHFVYFDASLTEGLASSLRDAMAEDYDPTDLIMIEQPELTAHTDVIAYSGDFGDNGAAGWVHCPPESRQGLNALGHRWCQKQTLWLNYNPRYAVFFADDASRDHITCHELGHTLGLRHWGNPPQSAEPAADTCMNANTPNGPTNLHQIDIDHINAYPYGSAPPGQGRTLAKEPGDDMTARSVWSGAGVETTQLEHPSSLDEVAGSADVAVRGRVVDVVPGRVFGDPATSALHYAAATVRVEELVAGALPRLHAEELTLEIPLFDGPGSIAELQASLPWAESIFFLRSKAASARAAGLPLELRLAEAGFYRLVVFGAAIENRSGFAAVADEEADFLAGLGGRPFDEVLDQVRAAGR